MWRIENPSHIPCKDTYSIYSETGERRRKRHQKSQNGCDFCRRRRIKCSEHRSVCSNCSRLRKVCNYRTRNDAPNPKGQLLHPSRLQNPRADLTLLTPIVQVHIRTALASNDGLDPDLIRYSPLIRSHSLECLGHFFRCDRAWLKHPHIQQVMQRKAIHQVLGHSYLLYATLAISAAHLALLQSGLASYRTMSMVIWQKSLRAFRKCLLGELESQNADALFFTSHLLASLNAHRRHTTHHDWQVTTWILLFRGVKALWDQPPVIKRLKQGMWQTWVEENRLEYAKVVNYQVDQSISEASDTIVGLLRSLTESLDLEETQLYSGRIQILEMLERCDPSPEATNLLSWFITRAPAEYMSRLQCRDHLALLLLLYWFRLTSKLGQWWLTLPAERESEILYAYMRSVAGGQDIELALKAMRMMSES